MTVTAHCRWFQFSLRTLLALVTLVVLLLVAWRVYVAPYQRQRETMALISELGGTFETKPAQEWLSWVLGYECKNIVFVDLADCDAPDRYVEPVASLPRLETLIVGGRRLTDQQLRRFHSLEALRALVLDSTSVTDAGIAALKEARPDVGVRESQRRTISAIREIVRGPFSFSPNIQTELSPELPHLRRALGLQHFEDVVALRFPTRVGTMSLAHLQGLKHLRELDLASTDVGDAGLACLRETPRLKVLSLSRTQVGDAGLAHLPGLVHLELLRLEKTQVSDDGLVHLRDLSNLRVLDLSFTLVGGTGFRHLRGLKKLRTLDLGDTRTLSKAGIANLKRLTSLRTLWVPLLASPPKRPSTYSGACQTANSRFPCPSFGN